MILPFKIIASARMRTLLLAILLPLAFFINSCDENRIYEYNIELLQKMWLADSILHFQFKIENSKKRYNLYYNLRNTLSYPFQNVYVKYSLQDTLENLLKEDLINRNVFHPKTGKPCGSGLGDVYDHQFLLFEKHKFNQAGVYDFSIQHYMRTDTLTDVVAVGLRVEVVPE